MPNRVLAVLPAPSVADRREAGEAAFRMADPDAPQIEVLDLGITRGDGVFETISVAGRRAQAVEPHLARLARSAAMLEMPEPDLAAWRAATFAVAAALPEVPEAFVKLVYTRGVEGGTRTTGYAFGEVSPDHTVSRTEGVSVVVLDRGYRHDVRTTAPWLLQGAKTLSYAVNRAAVREAHRRGADDVLFISSDGYLLEGPTANLLLRRGSRLLTPPTDLPILAGTTQADAFAYAEQQGLEAAYEPLTRDDLDAADALWLVSSVRHAAPIRAVDGVARQIDAAFSAGLNEHLIARRD
ncbi:aminotransferase class IV [Amnibacterium sp. CER49]|uniref:aminotransferase class IV n=1 Tax=Amnibacterium sp. CER49 TaxID=3039161 RepID=UPI00244A08B1|nr:aminotransferase class IV [Amnibacterium sp. CER49]MDH2442941.1 aminotransferase class IV [Amnibacterium sp. CER49]